MIQSVAVQKVCPLVVRYTGAATQLLAFEHPQLKNQFVKGTIDPGESAEVAAHRELLEESGLQATAKPVLVGGCDHLPDNNYWYFYLCTVDGKLPDTWVYLTQDDGGHIFRFFWHSLADPLDDNWHPLFHAVYDFVQPVLVNKFVPGLPSYRMVGRCE